jgi:nickel-type superoxide dismutase maturation protease
MRTRGLARLLIAFLALVAARRWLDVVEVRGHSMAPTLLPGDRLLVMRAPPRLGRVVLAADPRDPRRELIKRVARIEPSGVHLHGDNPAASTDARVFGPTQPSRVRWRAVLRYWPPGRIGSMPAAPPSLACVDEGSAMHAAPLAGHRPLARTGRRPASLSH